MLAYFTKPLTSTVRYLLEVLIHTQPVVENISTTMAPSPSSTLYNAALLALALAPFLVRAQGETGGGRIDSNQCPDDVESSMVFSPFKPYFYWPMFQGDVQKCWVAADCLFEAAGESRKQQFAATALVMGLIPLTLKDIAWPERRIIHVTNRLNIFIEIVVLALGLVPTETGNKEKTIKKSGESNMIAKAAWRMGRAAIIFWILACTILVLASYAGLAIMEIYSKRSALGCPFPIFVSAWYVIALVPAAIHALFASIRRYRNSKKLPAKDDGQYDAHKNAFTSVQARETAEEAERKKKIISAVQGADEDWPVQLAWGIYYIAGTLIFTSIMAVTVPELVVWVGLGFAVTGSSKVLAFFLCLVFEKTSKEATY